MKKSIYVMAAAALSLAACSKNELGTTGNGKNVMNIGVDVLVSQSETKVNFDGESHIAFDKNDYLTVSIAKPGTPNTPVKLATQNEAEAKNGYTRFKIVDAEAEVPVFSGTLWSITEDNISDEYILYSACPSSAFFVDEDLTAVSATVPYNQTTTQTAWDPMANAMIGEPVIFEVKESEKTKYNEYNVNEDVSVNLAHVFGFGRISFADVPEKYAGYKVNAVTIEAVGDNRNLAGSFRVDLTEDIQFQEVKKAGTYSYINVTPSEDVAVKDAVIWFEANPGNYDVKITVKTDRCDLEFERTGLDIERRCVAAPVVHFKEAVDVVKSFDVDLTGNKSWEMTQMGYNTVYTSPKEWGPDGMKMKFNLAWTGTAKSNHGTSYYRSDNGRVQGFNGSENFDGDKIILYSLSSFKGVESLYLNLGIYTRNASCDYTIALANGTDTTKVKTITVSTAEDEYTADGKYYEIENATDVKDGDLLIILDKLSSANIRPYMGSIVINPAPVVNASVNKISLPATAVSDKFDCVVNFSKVEPVVTSDADWLTVNYADGVITYSATANDGGKRTANIEVKLGGVLYLTIPVTQKTAAEIEYKLVVSPATMAAVLDKAKADYDGTVTEDTCSELNFTLTATATDGSGKTIEVPLKAAQIYYEYTDTSIKLKKTIESTSSLGYIEKVVLVGNAKLGSSYYANKLYWSADGSSYTQCKDFSFEGDSVPMTSIAENADEANTYFKIDFDFIAFRLYSLEVTFIGE